MMHLDRIDPHDDLKEASLRGQGAGATKLDDYKWLVFIGFLVTVVGQIVLAQNTPYTKLDGSMANSSTVSSYWQLGGAVVASLGAVLILKGAPKLPPIANLGQKIGGVVGDVMIGAIVIILAGFCAWLIPQVYEGLTSATLKRSEWLLLLGAAVVALVVCGLLLVFLYMYFYREIRKLQPMNAARVVASSRNSDRISTVIFYLVIGGLLFRCRKSGQL